MDRHYYKLVKVHILSQTLAFTLSQLHRKAKASATVTSTAIEIRLSEATTSITIIEMKTKAGLKATNEHLSAATTLIMINAIYLCVAT